MTERDRELVEALIPHMMRLPGQGEALLGLILSFRDAYHGRGVSLSGYKINLELRLDQLEHEAREIVAAMKIIRGSLTGPNMGWLDDIHQILDEALNGSE